MKKKEQDEQDEQGNPVAIARGSDFFRKIRAGETSGQDTRIEDIGARVSICEYLFQEVNHEDPIQFN